VAAESVVGGVTVLRFIFADIGQRHFPPFCSSVHLLPVGGEAAAAVGGKDGLAEVFDAGIVASRCWQASVWRKLPLCLTNQSKEPVATASHQVYGVGHEDGTLVPVQAAART
jgi:hypothetical protein